MGRVMAENVTYGFILEQITFKLISVLILMKKFILDKKFRLKQ